MNTQRAPLKVTHFKGLRLSNTDRYSAEVKYGEAKVRPTKKYHDKGSVYLKKKKKEKNGKGTTNNKVLNLFLPIFCGKKITLQCCFYSLCLVKFGTTF